MDQIQAMRIFIRVVEAGTFTRAAESLGLPKGTVTRLVQHLESRLKVRLLNRTTRRVTVTPDGAAYYERTTRLLNDLDDIEASMSNARVNPSGRLRVDVGTSVARLILIPALPDFYAKYPDIQLDLGVSDRPVDIVSDNVDCVIRGGDLLEQSLVARRVGNVPLVTVASREYVRRNGMPGHPSELEDKHTTVNYFSSRTGRPYPHVFEKDGETAGGQRPLPAGGERGQRVDRRGARRTGHRTDRRVRHQGPDRQRRPGAGAGRLAAGRRSRCTSSIRPTGT
jgi:LysR family transcriptional regulator for bpeEF and oprC